MMIAARPPEYAKAIAWIVRERGNKIPRDPVPVIGWALVRYTADLFDKSARDVANDVVEFAKVINGETEIQP
jgi:hypothetical protein